MHNKIAFLVPTYPPDYKYTNVLKESFYEKLLDQQADLWFVFTNEDEYYAFGDYQNKIILDKNFRIFEHRGGGIINVKKFYGLRQLQDLYEYIIVLDSESEFIKNVNIKNICDKFFEEKVLYGNSVFKMQNIRANQIKNRCAQYFKEHENFSKIKEEEKNLYLWFNNLCIYKTSTLTKFFELIDYDKNLVNLTWDDFDYYIYMYFLIVEYGFKVLNIGCSGIVSAGENIPSGFYYREKDLVTSFRLNMCAKESLDLFDNEELFIVIHLDRNIRFIINCLLSYINTLYEGEKDLKNKVELLETKLEKFETKTFSYKLKKLFSKQDENKNGEIRKIIRIFGVKFSYKSKNKNYNKKFAKFSSNISVVVQGPIYPGITSQCLKSIRKFLPNAQIILSTWEGSDISGLLYDDLVINVDCGAPDSVRSDGAVSPNNINRQLLTTKNGLKKANRKYCIKLRSDLVLTNNTFIKYLFKYKTRNKTFKFFNSKVVIPSVYTKFYSHINNKPVPYHPTDWWFLGLTDDIKQYFNIDFANDTNYFNWKDKLKNPQNTPYPNCIERYFTEQYYFIQAFSKKFDLRYDDLTCWNDYNNKLWQNLLVNNFIVLDTITHGIYSLKYPQTKKRNNGEDKSFKGLCWESDYKNLYLKNNFLVFYYIVKLFNFLFWITKGESKVIIKIFGIKISISKKGSK